MVPDYDKNACDGFQRGIYGLSKTLDYSAVSDGESCWSTITGCPWPTSRTPRSCDSLNLVRVLLYESLARVYGKVKAHALKPCALIGLGHQTWNRKRNDHQWS